MKQVGTLLLCMLLIIGLGACALQKEAEQPAQTPAPTQAPQEPAQQQETETTTSQQEDIVVTQAPIATITMVDGGVIKVELDYSAAPNTVKNFIALANDGFYDGTIFHRVISGFMIQGGDPTGTGMGGPDYGIKGEFAINGVKNDLSHVRGVISMARAQGYDTAGSQFFIVHQDADFLDKQYAAFGHVIEGMDVVDAIAATKTGAQDRPVADQVMQSVRVDTFGVDFGQPEKLPG